MLSLEKSRLIYELRVKAAFQKMVKDYYERTNNVR